MADYEHYCQLVYISHFHFLILLHLPYFTVRTRKKVTKLAKEKIFCGVDFHFLDPNTWSQDRSDLFDV